MSKLDRLTHNFFTSFPLPITLGKFHWNRQILLMDMEFTLSSATPKKLFPASSVTPRKTVPADDRYCEVRGAGHWWGIP